MKNKFLHDLREVLENRFVSEEEIKDIINDYSSLIDEGLNEGLNIDDVIRRLGSPKEIYYSLKDDLSFKKSYTNKITPLTVFITLILFILSGMVFNLWAYNWLLFLLIPIVSIITSVRNKKMIVSLSPFISLILFITFGMLYNIWHPMWLVFLLVPVSGILVSNEKKTLLVSLMPFISLTIYIILGYLNSSNYLYYWPVFMLIPLFGSLVIEDKRVKIITFSLIFLSTIAYIVISYILNVYSYPLFIFLIPLIYAVYTKEIKIEANLELFNNKILVTLLTLIIVVYLFITILIPNSWTYSWTILLFIPMLYVYSEKKFKEITPYMPFISLILFYLVGYFVSGGFKYSWLFFFLIPIIAIIFDKDENN